ncbi:CcmE domain-containing protein [Cephalotus follicularis]|uniref:CcmE domain-containing protein n=1 Tax=Cephalotus follicularis TaxID=3775 RepID=A0A1Q3D240_CEPFO|nr:CcmE domain-containing protein [Cephalotus follicularis]
MALLLRLHRVRSHLLRSVHSTAAISIVKSEPSTVTGPMTLRRLMSTKVKVKGKVDIGARARQLQKRRLWGYALTFSFIGGFIVLVLNNFQDQLVFYVTPTEALDKYKSNPARNKFRLGGLVLEGSVNHPDPSSALMEFVVTDLVTQIVVRFEGSLPDLFREGHSVVVEGFVKRDSHSDSCYFDATEVLAKHDEKYMPKEVAAAIEKNKKKLEEDKRNKASPSSSS